MGYTHYWRFRDNAGNDCAPKDIEGGFEKFKDSVALFRKVLEKLNGKTMYPNWGDNAFSKEVDMVLCGGNGEGEPTILSTKICFNGCRATDNSCETCYLDMDDSGFNFCKTCREPYDTAVWACLLCFKFYFGENIKLNSDGDSEERAYAEEVFNSVVEEM